MEGEVVDIGVRLLAPDMSVVKDFEDRCLRSTYEDQKQAFLNVRCPQVLISYLMLMFSLSASPDGNPVRISPAAKVAMEPPGHLKRRELSSLL
jgi:hypothetical protein